MSTEPRATTSHADALNDALDRIGRGQRIQAVLDEMHREGRYDATTLEGIAPALRAASGLRARPKARPRAEFRARLEAEVVALANEGDAARVPLWHRLRGSLQGGAGLGPKLALRALPLVLALFFSLSSVIVISADSRPGDPLHALQPIARKVIQGLERASAPVLERIDTFRGDSDAKTAADGGQPGSQESPESAGLESDDSASASTMLAENNEGSPSKPSAAATAVLRLRPATIPDSPDPSPEALTSQILAPGAGAATPVDALLPPPLGIATEPAAPVVASPTAEAPAVPSEPDPDPEPEPEPSDPEPEKPRPINPEPTEPSATPLPSATPEQPEPTVAPLPSQTPEPTPITCGGIVTGEARDLDGELYSGPPVLVLASLHPHWSMVDTVGYAEVVDGRYSIQLEPEVCVGQVETFYLLAMDRDSGAPMGFHDDPSDPDEGPRALSVHEREQWGEPLVTIFVHFGGDPGFWEACPPEDEVGTVSGSIQDLAGDPIADAIVLLFDANPESEPIPIDRFREAMSDAEGRFQIGDVCIGRYHALAIQEDEEQSFFGFWDPDDDGQPDTFDISREDTDRSGIIIRPIEPDWPEQLPRLEGW